jgi:hypothetical protein
MNIQSLAGTSLAVLIGLSVWAPTKAQADHNIDDVNYQLASYSQAYSRLGFNLNNPTYIDSIYADQAGGLPLYLLQGIEYQIVAACDTDCDDLTLQLYDEQGNLVSSDYSYGNVAEAWMLPRWDQTYYLQVNVPGCFDDYEGCYYGVNVYYR